MKACSLANLMQFGSNGVSVIARYVYTFSRYVFSTEFKGVVHWWPGYGAEGGLGYIRYGAEGGLGIYGMRLREAWVYTV